MADPGRHEGAERLLGELIADAATVAFYRALLTLEALLPARVAIGGKGPPAQERIRIRPSTSLACPATDVEQIDTDAEGVRAWVTVTFLGLYGADSPLPTAYTEHIARIAPERSGERVCSFLDVFHHRLYSLLYRAWRRSRPVSGMQEQTDPVYRALCVTGYERQLGLGGAVLPRLAEARLRVLRCRTADGLRAALRLRLGLDVEVQELVPRMVGVPQDQRSRLGKTSCQLGQTLAIGARIPDRNKVRLGIEASDHRMWQQLSASGRLQRQINLAVGSYLRDPLAYDIEVRMDAAQVPPCELGARKVALGRDAWLGRPHPRARWRWLPRRPTERDEVETRV